MSLEFRRIREKGQVTDFQVALTDREYQSLLQRCPEKDRHWQTSCYTYLVQTEIAKFHSVFEDNGYPEMLQEEIDGVMFHLREWTEQYAAFEDLINNPNSPIDMIDLLSANQCLAALKEQLLEHRTWLDGLPEHAMPKTMKDNLKNSCQNFLDRLEKFSTVKGKTTSDFRKIFSIQSEKSSIPSLGAFIADQMWHLTNGCIQRIYEITDNPDTPPEKLPKHNTSKGKFWNRVKQILLFKMDPAIKALSDAKSNIEVKGRSLHGIRYNNAISPIPVSMLESLKKLPEVQKNEKQWVSLSPFVDSLNDLEGLDRIISQIKDMANPAAINIENKNKKTILQRISAFISSFAVNFILLIANGVELALSLLLRVPYALVSTALFLPVRFLESMVSLVFRTDKFHFLSNALSWLDKLVANTHHSASLVRWAKILRNKHHVLKNADETKLSSLKNNAKSLYCTLLNPFSGENVSAYITQGLRSFRRTVGTVVKEPIYMMRANKKNRLKVLADYKDAIDSKFIDLLKNGFKNSDQSLALAKKDSEKEIDADPDLGYQTREKIQAWKANSIEMPIDFFVEIGVGLPDAVVGPGLRKSPGAATFFFMISNASLGTLIAGSAAGQMGNALAYVPSVLSKLFTGKEVSSSVPAQVIAVFLQWKLGFFTTEGIAAVLKGDFEFLKELFYDPEKITLALSILIFAGWAMQFVPAIPDNIAIGELKVPLAKIPLPFDVPFIGDYIPNLYFEFINMFSKESKELAKHGQIPASFLEDSFLSLKFGFLCEGLLSGAHKTKIVGFKDDLKKTIQTNKKCLDPVENGNDHAAARECVREILEQYHITPDQPLFDALSTAILDATFDLVNQAAAFGEQLQGLGSVAPLPANIPLQVMTPLETARKNLVDALQTVQKMDILGEHFSLTNARLYFDQLHVFFDKYNQELKKAGQSDKQIDPEDYLHCFYNKYCYKGSNNFLRALSILPFYPITKAYQLLQKGIAMIFQLPSTLHKVAKSEAKNTVMFWQSLAMFGRIGHEMVRAYVYSARAIICMAATPFAAVAAVLFPIPIVLCNLLFNTEFKPLDPARWLMNTAIDVASKINLHRSRGVAGIGDISYAKAARIAGTNSDRNDLSLQNKRVLKALLASKLQDREAVEPVAANAAATVVAAAEPELVPVENNPPLFVRPTTIVLSPPLTNPIPNLAVVSPMGDLVI